MLKAVRITVSGKVQGVFFRASTQEQAIQLGLKGWCLNLDGGDVEIHAEGPEEAINSLAEWCRTGPPMAVVKRVKTEEAELEYYEEFQIKRG